MFPHTIGGINRLPEEEKRIIFGRLVPPEIMTRFRLYPDFKDDAGNDLLTLNCPPGKTSAEVALYHQFGFPDPLLYGHFTDTINGQIHILLYVINNPDAPRFDVDRLPNGKKTNFGIESRNLEAERAALEAGLAPGQVRRGLRLLAAGVAAFEDFVVSLGQEMYFAEPLYYHNAVLFERIGFAYQRGRRLMERIQAGFTPGGDLLPKLDSSTPFRQLAALGSIRLRSWAIHDGLLGEPFTDVTMYKTVGKHAEVATCNGCEW